jgi:hypothetical protein
MMAMATTVKNTGGNLDGFNLHQDTVNEDCIAISNLKRWPNVEIVTAEGSRFDLSR